MAGRAVRRVKVGASSRFSAVRLGWKILWADSMQFYCHLRNVEDLLSDGKTPHERRFEEPSSGQVILFVPMAENHPISAKDQARRDQYGKKVFPEIFVGYALHAEGIWKGDILVSDVEEFASETHARRLTKGGSHANERRCIHHCSSRWISHVGRKRSSVPNTHLDSEFLAQGEEHTDVHKGKPDVSQQSDPQTDDVEVRDDYWSIQAFPLKCVSLAMSTS